MIYKVILALLLLIIVYFATISFLTRHASLKEPSERKLLPCPSSPNCVLSTSSIDAKKINAIKLNSNDHHASWKKLVTIIKLNGGEILIDDGTYLHAVFTSNIFRFKDDLEATLNENQIDIRSASRAGKSDFGKNRKRIEKIRALFQNH